MNYLGHVLQWASVQSGKATRVRQVLVRSLWNLQITEHSDKYEEGSKRQSFEILLNSVCIVNYSHVNM